MPTFYDSTGKPYVLNQEIGRGGEGTVFYCPDDLTLVAKIYHEPITAEKADKLRWMAENKDDQLLKVAAWIVDTLRENPNGKIVGFLMPNIKAKEIHELYSLKSRRVHFPEANWQFLLHSATNVARAFYVLHKHEHVMGDVNPGNCVVLADGRVKMIDCDSYSIKTDKIHYHCEVGVATHLAPELQGFDLSQIEREQTHDNFGLAVIIFQLLFLGRHPFAGNYLGEEDKSLEDCIRERRFAYGNQTLTNTKQPPGTLSLTQISPRIAAMFTAAFMTQNRPEPREWIEALEDLSNSLNQCSVHIGHHYFNELTACPWCEIESKTGLLLFPFISSNNAEFANDFNIFTVEKLLASLEIPNNLSAKPLKLSIIPPPSAEAIELHKNERDKFIILAFAELCIAFIFSVYLAPGCGFMIGIILMAIFLAIRFGFSNASKQRLQNELEEARDGWNSLENEWKKYNKDWNYHLDVAKIRQKVDVYQTLQKEKQLQLKQLSKEAFQYQLQKYLSGFKLAEAGLKGIDEEHLKVFEDLGIKTATDFDKTGLNSLVTLDEKPKKVLLKWRRKLENEFKFDANTNLPEVAQNRFELEFTEKRRTIEKEIEQLLVTLRSASRTLREQQKQMLSKAESLAQKLLQTESDYAKITNNAAMIIILAVIPLFVPMVVAVVQEAQTPFLPNTYNTDKTIISAPVPLNSNSSSVINAAPNYQVNENITEKEIEKMSLTEREKSGKALYVQALSLINQKDYPNAEKKLRLATKFIKEDTQVIYSLATVFYETKRYSESIKLLEKSLLLDSEFENAKLLIGANYLKMSKYEDARNIFFEVTEKNPRSFEGMYNLALAYKYLKTYTLAKQGFKLATEINARDTDAHYEYALVLNQVGEKEEAENQYYILQSLNGERAEKLRKLLKIPPVKDISVISNK